MYTTTKASEIFGVHEQTVRGWASDFEEFLSETANPKSGETRLFTEEDMRVLAYVSLKRKENAKITVPQLLDQLAVGNREDLPLTPAKFVESELEQVRSERDMLAKKIQELEIRYGVYEIDNNRLAEDNKRLHERVEALNREIGKLQAKVEMLSGNNKGD